MSVRIPTASGDIHVTYCLNIHPGETWAENVEAIRTHACEVRNRLGAEEPFGLGLRLGHRAAAELAHTDRLAEFAAFLERERLYAFTINGFPYGAFHGQRVKENVYAPDWGSDERVAYTLQLAEILARLLPDGVTGSISTVPGTYREWAAGDGVLGSILLGLGRAALGCAEIAERTGRHVRIAVEPEPDCLWDTSDQIVELFTEVLPTRGAELLAEDSGLAVAESATVLRQHLGVCLDTCHQAVLFEEPTAALQRFREAGVPVAKIQVSAAPIAACDTAGIEQLRRFEDPVYLHQSALRRPNGTVERFSDLPPALAVAESADADCELRTHFHIPLVIERWGALRSTRATLGKDFFALIRQGMTRHVEVETYTFDVLPEELKAGGVVANVAGELQWLIDRLGVNT